MNDTPHPLSRRTGFILLGILLGVFAVVLAVNLTMAYLAIHTNTGVVSEEAYEDGLKYNQTLSEEAREQALGWHLTRSAEAFPARLAYTLTSGTQPLSGAVVAVVVERPLADQPSLTTALAETVSGTYAAPLPRLAQGQWRLTVTATQGGHRLTGQERIIVRP